MGDGLFIHLQQFYLNISSETNGQSYTELGRLNFFKVLSQFVQMGAIGHY